MRRLDVDCVVREYEENRILYFNQSDGKFYASDVYTEIDSLPAPGIFVPANEIRMSASWDSETNTLKLFSADWKTTAPYALYFSQPTPVTLELVGDNSFVSNNIPVATYSAGIVSRSSLTIIGDSLKAIGGNYGLFSRALTINSGTLTASGETTAMQIEKDTVLRTPPGQYYWWNSADAPKNSSALIYNPSYKWIKIEVPPPDYELGASVNNNEPFVDEDIEITLTVKDITTGDIYESINGSHAVDLTGILTADFEITSGGLSSVQFANGVGKINLKLKKKGAQILWFSMVNPDYPAINPIVITPLPVSMPPETLPDISLHPDALTFPKATYGYSTQTPLNFILENRNGEHPTGELAIKLTGRDSASFTISSNKVATIAASGSVALKIAPISGLGAKTHTATIAVSGSRIAAEKKLNVSFTVEKAPGAKVATPTLANEAAKSVFIHQIPKPSTGQEVEYAISETNNNPKDSAFITFGNSLSILEFSNLKNTTYYIFARAKENANYKAGDISAPLESCVPFKEIAVSLWSNNTLTVINTPANNSIDSAFSDFTWFRDGQEISKGQSLSEDEYGKSLQSGKYHVEITTKDGKLISCKYEVSEPPIAPKTSPIDFSDVETVDVYSISGKHLARLNAQGSFPAEVRNFKNAYVLVLKDKTGTKKTIRAAEVLR